MDNTTVSHPSWLFIGTHVTCYCYCDKEIQENCDFYEICRVYYHPLCLKVYSKNKKHLPAIAIAQADLDYMKANLDKPIMLSSSGQFTYATVQ